MSATASLKTFLWFPSNLGEALQFYEGLFKENLVIHSAGQPEPDGKLMTADFSIFGQEFIGMGWPGGPQFNDSISLSINCDGQDQVDYYWDAITERGKPGQCGWCVDEFGLSWQVTPIQMREHLQNPDPQKSAFAWQAMRGMTKIVIQDLIKND